MGEANRGGGWLIKKVGVSRGKQQGLAERESVPDARDRWRAKALDWIFVIDETVGLGALKCLTVLGIPAGRLAETGYWPRHGDMTVLAVDDGQEYRYLGGGGAP